MWYALYNVLLIVAAPVILVILAAKRRCRRGLPERLGFRLSRPGGADSDQPVIWVHAVSLGEVVAVAPLVRRLHERVPRYRIIVSTVTETGREAVEARLAGVAEHRYAPLDFPWVLRRVLKLWQPILYLFVETELWPNLLRMLERRGVPSVLVNGRLSTRSYERQRIGLVRPLYARMLRSIACCLMQSQRDAQRLVDLGADPAKVRRTGNIKFDQPLPTPPEGHALSRSTLGLADDERLFIAGSTHAGEEEQLLRCYQQLHREISSLVLMLAPRHIERAAQVELAIRAAGLPAQRRSTLGAGTAPAVDGPRVIILDTRGELAWLYREAVIAFVGGTFVPVGGHNLLEPAVWGKPVFFGPHTDHCAEIAALLLEAEGGRQVEDAEALARHVKALFSDQDRLARMGDAARRVVQENQGALERSLQEIVGFLRPESSRGPAPEPLAVNRSHSGL